MKIFKKHPPFDDRHDQKLDREQCCNNDTIIYYDVNTRDVYIIYNMFTCSHDKLKCNTYMLPYYAVVLFSLLAPRAADAK